MRASSRPAPAHRVLRLLAWALLLSLLFPWGTVSARAMSVVSRDFEALVARAETVFRGVVTGEEALWIGDGETRRIVTRVTFRVTETLKGDPLPTQILQFLGGTVDGETMEIAGMPRFTSGEEAVLFVINNGGQICPLVGAYQGRFRVVTSPGDGEALIYSHDRAPVTNTADLGVVDANGIPRLARRAAGSSGARALGYAEFRRQILEKLADRVTRGAPLVERGAN